MMRKALGKKILILGVDGMDPSLTRKFVQKGLMPNVKKIIDQGAQREDLTMLGGQPTGTPPMWTTLATGAYPVTHGITCFHKQSKEDLDVMEYALDSRLCKAEQLWNVFAEAGKKTLVWHWPGSAWPPSSESPNLHVVDGTSPGAPNMASAQVEGELVLVASEKTEEIHFRAKAASDGNVPCVITDLKPSSDFKPMSEEVKLLTQRHLILSESDGEMGLSDTPFDVVLSPIKDAKGWVDVPEGAKEFTILLSGGLIRRPSLILKDPNGVYSKVAIYKSKKEKTPIVVLENDVFTREIIDESVKDDVKYSVNRNMRVLEIAEDGSYLKMWISSAMNIVEDSVWYPKHLYKSVTENVGYPPPTSMVGGADKQLISKCMKENWDSAKDWQAGAINHLIQKEGYDVVFSHFHNIDLQSHMIIKYLKDGHANLPKEEYAKFVEEIYIQTDEYIGQFMHLLEEDWTICVISDHAAVCPEHGPHFIGDMLGLNVRVMQELGFTALKKDEDGNELPEIDWQNTKAIANRANHIYLNIKGRDKHGIIDPKDKFEVEEEIMTALYGYKDKKTGHRVIAMALRNKDAVLLGLGGPESGDIIYWTAEGYNYDHFDCLSTTRGYGDTSVSPIFIGVGPGLKKGFATDRIIRQVDFAPTIAVIGGVRMPAQCEGAPVYQILSEEY
nr:alkaline phosphatase family protein [Desulfosporosinus orientis]